MASRIESDSPSSTLRRQAEQQASPAVAPNPVAPGTPPKPIPRRAVPQPADGLPKQEQAEDEEIRPSGSGLFGQIPACGISVLMHVIAILVMAMMAGETVRIEKPTVINASVSEAEDEFSEFEDPQEIPQETRDDVTDPVADLVMTTTEVVVAPTEVPSLANDLEAAPLAVGLTDFSSDMNLASHSMQTAGAGGGGIGGTGGGLGGRGTPGQLAAARGGGADTEAAVDRALKWLAEHQLPDGGWDFDLRKCPGCEAKCSFSGVLPDRSAATALGLLPFMGRGYTHREGPYQKQVEGGIRFLLNKWAEGKDLAIPSGGNLYTQGLVGIVLSECYAMSRDDALAAPAQVVLNSIMQAQDPVGGGWRYTPRQPGDTSSLGWQIMALKSGNMAALQINPLTIKKAGEFLDSVQADEEGATYKYDLVEDPTVNPTRSAIGLLCRMYLGWEKDHPGLQRGALELAKLGPTADLYFDYYATQVLHHMEGETWIAWNNQMKALLLETQSSQGHEVGSWYDGVSAGGQGAPNGGRLYCTAMATLILEVYYRHLPIYSTQSVTEEFRE
jgi:hypothetical protein